MQLMDLDSFTNHDDSVVVIVVFSVTLLCT